MDFQITKCFLQFVSKCTTSLDKSVMNSFICVSLRGPIINYLWAGNGYMMYKEYSCRWNNKDAFYEKFA